MNMISVCNQVLTTVFTENVPQLGIQFYFLFVLGLRTNTAVLTSTSSSINILLSVMTAVVSFLLNRKHKELGFTLKLDWSQSASSPLGSGKVDPFWKTGRRQKLAKTLQRMDFGMAQHISFEILAAENKNDVVLIYGVIQFGSGHNAAPQIMAALISRENAVKRAIVTSFGFEGKYSFFSMDIQAHNGSIAGKVISYIEYIADRGYDPNLSLKQIRNLAESEVLCFYRFLLFFAVFSNFNGISERKKSLIFHFLIFCINSDFLQIRSQRAGDSQNERKTVSVHKVMSNSLHFSVSSVDVMSNGNLTVDVEQMELGEALENLDRLQALGINESLLDSLRVEVLRISLFFRWK